MIPRRRTRFTRPADARAHSAAAPLLAELRDTLLIEPDALLGARHMEMMRLEQQLLGSRRHADVGARVGVATPKRSDRNVSISFTAPRRAAALIVAVCLAFAGAGLDAVGALPAPLQHISDTIKHHLGIATAVPRADAPTHTHPHRRGHPVSTPPTTTGQHAPPALHHWVPTGSEPAPSASVPPAGATTADNAPVTVAPAPTTPVAVVPVKPSGAVPSKTPAAPTPPTRSKPPKKDRGSSGGPPPGYPTDWQKRAVAAAVTQLQRCAGVDGAAPTDCPQQLVLPAAEPGATPPTVQWTLLDQSLFGAIAIAQTTALGGTQVMVYGRFQMTASYTLEGTPAQHAYSGGLTAATLHWTGTTFDRVDFADIAETQLPTGVTVPLFRGAPADTDAAVRAELLAGFRVCATTTPSADTSVNDCPQPASAVGVTDARWTLIGDPTQAAVVTFDPERGDYTVTGTYSMQLTADDAVAKSVTGSYSATLAAGTAGLRLITITGT